MTEKNKTIDGMKVRRGAVRRRGGLVDGLKPATGTKTTASREVRMRQAEKVLREREARERTVREARIRAARMEAAQLRVAQDPSVKPVQVIRSNVYMGRKPVVKPVERRPIEHAISPEPILDAQAAASARRAAARMVAANKSVVKNTTPREERRRATVEMPRREMDASELKRVERVNRNEGRLAKPMIEGSVEDFLGPVEAFGDVDETKREFKKKDKKMKEEKKSRRKEKSLDDDELKPKKKKGGFWRWFRWVLLILVLGAIVFVYAWSNGLISKLTGGQSGIFDIITAVVNPDVELKKGENGRTNVLVFGTSGYEMDGSGHDGAQLTDSIMVVSFDKETEDVVMVNLPRDLYVGNTCTATGKVNEVYWCANTKGDNEAAGAKALQDTVERILGVDTQYYVHVNWGALVQIVDALGDLTVTLDEDINDTWTKTFIKAGVPTTLNGEQALGLARARHGTEQGDFSRGASQQKLLIALQQKILDTQLDVGRALALVGAVGDNLRTNFTVEEIKSMVHLAADVDIANMRQVALMTNDSSKNYLGYSYMPVNDLQISYVVPTAGTSNYTAIKKLIAKEFSTDLATREGANIEVLNGSGEAGVASKERDSLETNGFVVGKIGDAPDGEYPNHYYLYDMTARCPGTLTSLEKRYGVTALPAETLPEGIASAGFDFIVIVGKSSE